MEIKWNDIDNAFTPNQARIWIGNQLDGEAEYQTTIQELMDEFHWTEERLMSFLRRSGVKVNGKTVCFY